jgi:hypothetical protein
MNSRQSEIPEGKEYTVATIPNKKPMPFPLQGGKGGPNQEAARTASSDAAKRRLNAMRNGKKSEVK